MPVYDNILTVDDVLAELGGSDKVNTIAVTDANTQIDAVEENKIRSGLADVVNRIRHSSINVLDHGVVADWDGTDGTDNREAIQDLIDRVQDPDDDFYGKELYFPRGSYHLLWDGPEPGTEITYPVLVVANGTVRIRGDGPNATFIHWGYPDMDAPSYLFHLTAELGDFHLSDLTVEGETTEDNEVVGGCSQTVIRVDGRSVGELTITNAGTPGSTEYDYRVIGKNTDGRRWSAWANKTTTGHATLDGTNYNVIDWAAFADANDGYDIIRYRGGSSQGLIGSTNAATTVFNDQGAAASPFPETVARREVKCDRVNTVYVAHVVRVAADNVDVLFNDCDMQFWQVACRAFDLKGSPFWDARGLEYRARVEWSRCRIHYVTNASEIGEHCGYINGSYITKISDCTLEPKLVGVQIATWDETTDRGGSLACVNTTFGRGCTTGINGHQFHPTLVTNCTFLCSVIGITVQAGGLLAQGCLFKGPFTQAAINVLANDGGLYVANCSFLCESSTTGFGIIYCPQQTTQPLRFQGCLFNPGLVSVASRAVYHDAGAHTGEYEFQGCKFDISGTVRAPEFHDIVSLIMRDCVMTIDAGFTMDINCDTGLTTRVIIENTEITNCQIRALGAGTVTWSGRNNSFGATTPPRFDDGTARDADHYGSINPRDGVSTITLGAAATAPYMNGDVSTFRVTGHGGGNTLARMYVGHTGAPTVVNPCRLYYGVFRFVFVDGNVTISGTSGDTATDIGKIKPKSTSARAAGSTASFFYDRTTDIWYEI